MNTFFGIVLILHGLVHIWFVTMNQGWVELKPEMGWTGKSWLLTGPLGQDITQPIATIFYGLATITFIIAGIGLLSSQDWTRLWVIIASSISAVSILLFWDGNFCHPVEKGLIGLILDVAILISAIWFGWPKF